MEWVQVIVLGSYGLALGCLLLALRARQRERLLVGSVVCTSLPGRAVRRLGGVVLLATGGLALSFGSSDLLPLLPLLLLALVVNHIRPGELDRVAGSHGLRAGWNSRAYEQLEEWRMTGDHLRFRLNGQWTAVPVPVEQQSPIKAQLLEHAADRESSFNQ